MPLFDINTLFSDKPAARQTEKSTSAVERFEKMHSEKIHSLKQLIGRVPLPGEVFFLWTLNSFNAFTFITYIIKYFGTIHQLTFSTYSINERILASLVRWYDKGAIENIYLHLRFDQESCSESQRPVAGFCPRSTNRNWVCLESLEGDFDTYG